MDRRQGPISPRKPCGRQVRSPLDVRRTNGLPYGEIAHLRALTDYFDILGIDDISRLTDSNIGDTSDDESEVVAERVSICISLPNKYCPVYQDVGATVYPGTSPT